MNDDIFDFTIRLRKPSLARLGVWLPSRGNVLFTLVMIGVLLWAQSAGAVPFRAESAASTGTIAYQGRLADSSGNPLTSTLNMSFRLYSAVTGGTPLWTEQWTGANGVKVSDGLFNVMLGSLTPIAQSVITGNSNLFLGITVGTDDEMSPRVQLGSVPFAVQALTVPDGSITAAKLAGDVSLVPPDGSITTAKLADGAVTSLKFAPTYFASSPFPEIWSTTVTGAWTDVPPLSITVPPSEVPQDMLALIFATVRIATNRSGADVFFSITVDGQRYSKHGLYQSSTDISGSSSSSFTAVVPLSAGQTHQIGVQVYQGATSGTLSVLGWEDDSALSVILVKKK